MTAAPHYTAPAQALHWLTALAIFCVVPLGLAMVSADAGSTQNQLYDLHRSFGALILTLTGLRLLWRLYSPPPPLVEGMAPWQRQIAQLTHFVLYFLLFAVPLLGWAGTSAYGARISVFGLFDLPMILDKDRDLASVLLTTHGYLAFTLCAVFIFHIGAALYHHFIRKDETLPRMLPLMRKN